MIGSASVGMLFVQLRGETDRTEEEVAPGNSDLVFGVETFQTKYTKTRISGFGIGREPRALVWPKRLNRKEVCANK